MGRHIMLLLIWFTIGSTPAPAKEGRSVLEAAPLQGALGQVSARVERAWRDTLRLGAQVEHQQRSGERGERSNLVRRLSFEVVQYPGVLQLDGLFLAAGLDYEFAQIARRRERDYVSTIRYTEHERYDLWTNEDHHALAHAGVGYRFYAGSYATASLRYVRESLLFSHREVRRETIYSLEPDLSSPGHPRQEGRISMFVGVSLD